MLDYIVLLYNLGLWERKHGNSNEPFFKRIDEDKQGQDAKGSMGARSSLETLCSVLVVCGGAIQEHRDGALPNHSTGTCVTSQSY